MPIIGKGTPVWLNEKGQKPETSPKALEGYVGTYWDDLHAAKTDVILSDKRLYWLTQSLEPERFPLCRPWN